jgi:hypothetical protein
MFQCVGAHLLLIYPPPFDHQRNEKEIAREQNDQVHIKSVEVEITDDQFENSVVPSLEIEDEDSPIEFQGAIINWLQREYGEHVEVVYTSYEEYLVAMEQWPTLLSNTQSKSLQFNPPKSSHKTYCA